MKALRSFLCLNFKEYASLAKAFSFWLVFCIEILHGAQMSVYCQNGYPEAFHIYYWRWQFHQS